MKLLSLVMVYLLFTGCAGMQKEFLAQTCNKEGAFQKGYNDAVADSEMNNYWTNQCPPESQQEVRQAYQAGFTQVRSQRPLQINIVNGKGPGWECKKAYGKKACGYDCKEAYGNIRCAKSYGHNCVENYGKIKCGHNCKADYGDIKCDSYE